MEWGQHLTAGSLSSFLSWGVQPQSPVPADLARFFAAFTAMEFDFEGAFALRTAIGRKYINEISKGAAARLNPLASEEKLARETAVRCCPQLIELLYGP